MSAKRLRYIIASAIAVVAFVVYAVTLCPTTDFIDAGELTTVCATLGIAHPTGYPLFTLVGWVFAHLPLPLRIVARLNLMAAVFCAGGLFVFFLFFVNFLSAISLKLGPVEPRREARPAGRPREKADLRTILQVFVPAAAGTLCLGFSETYWSQAVAIEVYSVHLFLIGAVLLLFTKAISSSSPGADFGPGGRSFYWYAFAFVLGLSFTNHMTTILLAPGCLYFYFSTCGFRKHSWKRLGAMIVPFLVGFSLYLYLPIRASQHPLMNWGNPVDLERFLWHFSGKQYRVWIFSSVESAGRQLNYFLDGVLPEFVYLPVLLAAFGLWKLFVQRRRAAVFTLLLFLGCLLYSINYDIHDIDSYFLLAYVTIALWAAHGAAYLIGAMKDPRFARGAAAAVLAVSLAPLAGNFGKVDESNSTLVENYTRDMFSSLEPDAIILTYEWDYFVSAAYYFQNVENLRPDVIIIDKELLRRSWYFQQIQRRYPWLIQRSRKELDAYLAELTKFEHGLPYDDRVIEFRYNEFIHSIIRKNYSSHAVYATPELESQYTSGYNRVPSGLAFRLFADSLVHEILPPAYRVRSVGAGNKYGQNVRQLYARSYLNTAIYLSLSGKDSTALSYVDSASRIDPDMREAQLLREKILKKGPF